VNAGKQSGRRQQVSDIKKDQHSSQSVESAVKMVET
jgi:hypothetical protein